MAHGSDPNPELDFALRMILVMFQVCDFALALFILAIVQYPEMLQ